RTARRFTSSTRHTAGRVRARHRAPDTRGGERSRRSDMSTPVLMPQMGESIAEGTIVRWIKKVGDRVERDEPLFEISTDKVDAEIPSPAAGILAEIRVREGDTAPVNSLVPTRGDAVVDGQPVVAEAAAAAAAGNAPAAAPATTAASTPATEDERRARSSPLVRRIAKEHGVDITRIPGTGVGGRVTKQDILAYLERRAAEQPAAAPEAPPVFRPGERVHIEPMSVMRRKIAEHMVLSKRTSAHVHSVFEVNFSRVTELREARKADYERDGTKLTYLPFIARAV